MKILITGGHLAPALALIDEVGNRAEVIFAGRKYPQENERTLSLEYLEIKKRRIPFYHIQAGRLTRILNLRSLSNILKIPFGFYQAGKILIKVRPDLIMSFGGYIGFPICFIGFLLDIPVFIHEQTIKPGLTNRLTGLFARLIFISFSQTKDCFPSSKVIISGNPVRKNVLTVKKKPFHLKKDRPVIYITGGSLGSHSVNILIEKVLPRLLKKYIIIHQTGRSLEYDDYHRLLKVRATLPTNLKENYFLKDHFFEDELGYVYAVSDLVVGRSGANTAFELMATRIPVVFVPLPWSANQEQLAHARLFQKAGVGEIFQQSENSQTLLKTIDKVITRVKDYKNNYKNVELYYRQNAAQIIAQTIFSQNTA